MVAYTVSQLLPYAEDGDRACDSPAIIQELAETIEARLGSLEDVHDDLDLRPAAKMYTTPQPTHVPHNFVAFDHVDFDTANLVDLDLDNLAIVTPTPAAGTRDVWLQGSHYSVSGATNADLAGVTLSNSVTGVQTRSTQRDNAAFSKGHAVGNVWGSTSAALYTSITPSQGAPVATVNLDICEQYGFRIGSTS